MSPTKSPGGAQAATDLAKIYRDRRLDRSEPISSQLAVLEELATADVSGEQGAGRSGCIAAALLPVVIGAGLLGWIVLFGPRAERFDDPVRVASGCGFVVVLSALMYYGLRAHRAARLVIPDGLRNLLLPVVTGLQAHVSQTAIVQIQVDLVPGDSSRKRTFASDAGLRGFFKSLLVTGNSEARYQDPWALVAAPVAGGAVLRLRFRDEYQCLSTQVSSVTSPGGYEIQSRWNKSAQVAISLQPADRQSEGEPVILSEQFSDHRSAPDGTVPADDVLQAIRKLLKP